MSKDSHAKGGALCMEKDKYHSFHYTKDPEAIQTHMAISSSDHNAIRAD